VVTRDAVEPFEELATRLTAQLNPADAPAFSDGDRIHAAVMLLLRPGAKPDGTCPDGAAEILFIKRSKRAGDPWSGHVAFPGGRSEPADAGLLQVAVREVLEEVGIDVRRGGRVLGRLPTVEPSSARVPPIDVTPFVARAPEGVIVHPDPAEVEDTFWVSLPFLRSSGPSAVVRRLISGELREWPAYPTTAGPIWGITERILSGFLALV
jgi:8-oxo-dGTP pyrophosphatase MutT (NUDIX family)